MYGGFTNAYQGFGAKATAFAPSVSFVIWDVPIEVSFEIASIGAEIGYINGEFHFGGAYGFGFDITIYLNEE